MLVSDNVPELQLTIVKAIQVPASNGKNYQTLVYWGQNKLGVNLYSGNPAKQEPSLATICQTTVHETVTISFIATHFSTNGMPGMDFSTHCKTPFYDASLSDPLYKSRQKLVLLKCPDIGQDILTCQAAGKKVLIGLSPLQSELTNDQLGVQSAQNFWNLFLGGNGDRPFGNGITLDGVDMVLHHNEATGNNAMTQELRRLINASPKPSQFQLIASPRCSFPDATMGPTWANLPLTNNAKAFDYINPHFRYSTDCTYNHPDFFFSTMQKWADFCALNGVKLMFTVPTSSNSWIGGAPGDFIPARDLLEQGLVLKMQAVNPLTGVGFWDASGENLQLPCSNSSISYGSYWHSMMNGVSMGGCDYAADPFAGTTAPTPTNTDGGGPDYGGQSSSGSDMRVEMLLLMLILTVCMTV